MDALEKAEALTAYKNELLDEVCQNLLDESEIPARMLKKQIELKIDFGSKAPRIKKPPKQYGAVSGKLRPKMSNFVVAWSIRAAHGMR